MPFNPVTPAPFLGGKHGEGPDKNAEDDPRYR